MFEESRKLWPNQLVNGSMAVPLLRVIFVAQIYWLHQHMAFSSTTLCRAQKATKAYSRGTMWYPNHLPPALRRKHVSLAFPVSAPEHSFRSRNIARTLQRCLNDPPKQRNIRRKSWAMETSGLTSAFFCGSAASKMGDVAVSSPPGSEIWEDSDLMAPMEILGNI